MSVSFANTAPRVFQTYQPESTTQAISRRQIVEFPAEGQNSYKFGGMSEIRINISSNTDVMKGSESFIAMDLTFTRSAASFSANHETCNGLRFEMGGLHSLFSKIEIKSIATNTTLQTYELYNKYYVLKSRLFRPVTRDHISLDGDGFEAEDRHYLCEGQPMTIFKQRTKSSPSFGQLAEGQTTFIGDVERTNNYPPIDNDICTQNNSLAYNATTAAVDLHDNTLQSYMNSAVTLDHNDVVPTIVQYKMRFTPMCSFLLQDIPLLLMKNGIQVILTLATPTDALYMNPKDFRFGCFIQPPEVNAQAFNPVSAAPGGNVAQFQVSINIDNPRYVCAMVTPTDEYQAQLIAQYRSPSGIFMNIPSYRLMRLGSISNSSAQNFIMNPGVRSMRNVFAGFFNTVMQTNTSNDPGVNFIYRLMNHSHLPVYISTQYAYWNIGSTKFPNRDAYIFNNASSVTGAQVPTLKSELNALYDRVVNDFHISNCELFAYCRQGFSMRTQEYDQLAYATNANSFYYPMLPQQYPGYYIQAFSRDNERGSELTGVDVSTTPLEFHCLFKNTNTITTPAIPPIANDNNSPTFANQPFYNQQALWSSGSLEFLVFADHDAFVQISSQGVVVLT